MLIPYHKLVRDKIPSIIAQNGKTAGKSDKVRKGKSGPEIQAGGLPVFI